MYTPNMYVLVNVATMQIMATISQLRSFGRMVAIRFLNQDTYMSSLVQSFLPHWGYLLQPCMQ